MRELSASFAAIQAILDAIPNPVFVKGRSNRIVVLNSSACAFFGHSRETLLTKSDFDLFPHEQVRVFHEADDRAFRTGEEGVNEEQVTDASGRVRSVITRKRLARLEGADFLVASVTDVSASREAEARNRYLAFHDTLTGLPNRVMLKERIEQALADEANECALLYVGIDRFKVINDSHGNSAGDELIQEFARRLNGLVRPVDTVARLGGDEFAILIAARNDDLNAEELSERVLKAAACVFELTGVYVAVSASVGVALADHDAICETELQRRAEVALYKAKNEGRGCFRVFTQALDDSVSHRNSLQDDLRQALVSGSGIEVHYQPIVSVSSGGTEGFEALARWKHPARGLVMPSEFIPVAESTGLIVQLGEWVLARACEDATEWDPELRVAVNISPVQFAFGDLAGTVTRVLAQSGLDPRRLELEITEGVLIQDPTVARITLDRIRALGVQIVLDDFGMGYSSLSYIRQFPLDKIKIDRSFIAEMLDNSEARSIVQAVISLGRGLNLQVVAEGVETHQQLALLMKQGCTQAQGYLFGRPVTIAHLRSAMGKAQKTAA